MSTPELVTIGESLALVTPDRIGRLAHAKGARIGFGGAESNVAIGAARLGACAGWVGRVGDDGFGELILRELRAEGVETFATIDVDLPTSLMLKERPGPGRSRVTYYRVGQAGSRLCPADVPAGLVEGAKILHVTGILAGLGGSAHDAVLEAISRAKSAGVIVSFDVNHRSALWHDGREPARPYREMAAMSDIVFAGDDEAALFLDETDPERQAARLRDEYGVSTAVIKLGDQGALATEGTKTLRRPAVPVTVVDTVGAGDAFVAGWLADTLTGASLDQRMRTATVTGAVACTADGDWEAAASRSDLGRVC